MSLAELFNVPADQASLGVFLFANFDEHRILIDRVFQQKGVLFPMLDILTMDPANPGIWAVSHQGLHNALDGILGQAGNDYTNFDPNDRESLEGLIRVHAEAHVAYRALLGG